MLSSDRTLLKDGSEKQNSVQDKWLKRGDDAPPIKLSCRFPSRNIYIFCINLSRRLDFNPQKTHVNFDGMDMEKNYQKQTELNFCQKGNDTPN